MFGTSTINPVPTSAQAGHVSGGGHQSGRWGTVNVASHDNQNQLSHPSPSNAVVSGQVPVPRSLPNLLPKPAFQQASLVSKATEQRNQAFRDTFEANKQLVSYADEIRIKVQNKVKDLQQQVEVLQHQRANITPQALNALYERIKNLTTLTQSYGQVVQENTDCVRMLGEAVERLQEAKIYIRNLNGQNSDLREQAEGLQGDKQGLEKSLKDCQASLIHANKNCSELSRALTESQTKGAYFESLVQHKESSIKAWQVKHDALVRFSHELKVDLEKLRTEHDLIDKDKNRFQLEVQSLNTAFVQAEGEVTKLKHEIDDLKRRYTYKQSEIDSLEAKIEEKQALGDEYKGKIEVLQTDLTTAVEDYNYLNTQYNQAVEQLRTYDSEQVTRINRELKAAMEKMKSKEDAIQKLDTENFRLKQEIQDLEDTLKHTKCKHTEESHSLETHYLDALKQKEALIHTTISEKNELQDKLQELKNSHKQTDQISTHLQQAQLTIADLQSRLDAREREFSGCNETIRQQTDLIAELKEMRLQTTVVVESLHDQANSLRGEFQQLRGDIEKNSKNATEIRSQLANLADKFKELMAKDDQRLQSCIKDLTVIQENFHQYDKDNVRQVHRINSLESQTSVLTDEAVNLLRGGVTAEKISSSGALRLNFHENRESSHSSHDRAYSVHMRLEDVSSEPSSPSSHMATGMSHAGSKSAAFKEEVPLEQEIRECSSGNDDGMSWKPSSYFASSDAASRPAGVPGFSHTP